MRKVIIYTVSDEGRDTGKKFKITEMPAFQAHKFALKAFSKAVRAGMNTPKGAESSGMMALAKAGYSILVAMPFELSEELFDELFACVQVVTSANIVRSVDSSDIEEIQTILKLNKAVYELHVDFFPAGSQLTSESEISQQVVKKPSLNIKIPRR